MTIEEKIKQLEDAIIKLAELLERTSKIQQAMLDTISALLEKLKYQGITR